MEGMTSAITSTTSMTSANRKLPHVCVGAVTAGLIVIVIAAAAVQTKSGDDRMRKERSRIHSAAVYATALLAWPLAVERIVGFSRISEHPVLLGSGFAWGAALIAWEMTGNMDETLGAAEARQRSAETKNFASVVIGAAWAVGTLVSALRTGGGQSAEGSKVLLLSLILCIAFIVPLTSEAGDVRDTSSVVLRSAQRSALHYSVGLFIMGVGLSCM